ncbi:amidohydrolase [Actinocorallia longicatena]|uniref:Amidohydrolase n=1 Tax=Actinocorallia longicatena TaxID=111803 RepID=A0ABP6QLA2_9ACTN
MRIRTIITGGAVVALGLSVPAVPASAAVAKADLVLRHGSVETGKGGRAKAVAVRRGTIVYVGTDAGVRRYVGEKTRVVNLRGRTVMPGIEDGHLHLTPKLPVCDLEYRFLTVPETQALLRECLDADKAAGKTDADWMTVLNWDLPGMKPAGTVPTKALLDALGTRRPIYMFSDDGHNALVNSRALELAGITKATKDPRGGVIVRDASGEPTGYLKEDTAIDLVRGKIPPAPLAERVEGLRATLKYVTSYGLTAYQPQLLTEADLQAWKYLADRHELPGRVVGSLNLDANAAYEDLPGTLKKIKALRKKYEGPNFAIRTVGEIFADGVIEYPNQTALLLKPYLVRNAKGRWVPGKTKGPVRVTQKRLNRVVAALDKARWQVHVHAIGDGAVREALDSFAYARKRNGDHGQRHVIAHAQLVDPADYQRFRKLNVTPSVAVQWAEKDPYTMESLKPYIGTERWKRMYPWNSLIKAGARIANGSDFPVDSLNPMEQLEKAVTRTTEDTQGNAHYAGPLNAKERITLSQAIRIHTLNTAYLLGLEKKTGSLEVGKRFDAIVLSGNIREVRTTRISDLKVTATLVGGKVKAGRL